MPRTLAAACGAAAESRETDMDEQLATAAKTLARWCYRRGVDERVLGCGEQLRKAAVDQALGRLAPAHLEHALWQQTATLLCQRRDWDRDHQVSQGPPRHACRAPCRSKSALLTLTGAVVPAVASCTGSSLRRASTPTLRVTGPVRADPGRSSSNTAQLLGATLLAQSA